MSVPDVRRSGIEPRTRSRLALAAAFGVLVWLWGAPVLWPLSVAVVFAHEVSHALMTWVTGGHVLALRLGYDEGGETLSYGGIHWLILNAGYLGSLLFGILLLRLVNQSRGVCAAIGLGSMLIALLWMPWISFGFVWTMIWGAFLGWVGVRADPWVASTVVRLYGVYSVLYAFGDIRADVFGAPNGAVTDASMLAELTGIPAMIWGIGWMIVGVIAVWANRSKV